MSINSIVNSLDAMVEKNPTYISPSTLDKLCGGDTFCVVTAKAKERKEEPEELYMDQVKQWVTCRPTAGGLSVEQLREKAVEYGVETKGLRTKSAIGEALYKKCINYPLAKASKDQHDDEYKRTQATRNAVNVRDWLISCEKHPGEYQTTHSLRPIFASRSVEAAWIEGSIIRKQDASGKVVHSWRADRKYNPDALLTVQNAKQRLIRGITVAKRKPKGYVYNIATGNVVKYGRGRMTLLSPFVAYTSTDDTELVRIFTEAVEKL